MTGESTQLSNAMAAARAFYASSRHMLVLAGPPTDSKIEACRWLLEKAPRSLYAAPDGTEHMEWPDELRPRIIHASVIRDYQSAILRKAEESHNFESTDEEIEKAIYDYNCAYRCSTLVVDASDIDAATAECVSQFFKRRHEWMRDTILLLTMDRCQFSETFSDSTQDCFRVDGIWCDCDGSGWSLGTGLERPTGFLGQPRTWLN